MKKEDLYNGMTGIRAEYLEEAEVYQAASKARKPRRWKGWVSVAACLCLLLGTSAACYAANVGGIQRQVQLWIDGDKTNVVIEFNGAGEYALTRKDAAGNVYAEAGGGVKFDRDGKEIPVTEEDLLKEIFAPNVTYEDGRAVLTYYNEVSGEYYSHTLDITDLFEDGACYITLMQEGEPLYITVKYQKGLATSPDRYLSPAGFN